MRSQRDEEQKLLLKQRDEFTSFQMPSCHSQTKKGGVEGGWGGETEEVFEVQVEVCLL